jgi:hypothetical protein
MNRVKFINEFSEVTSLSDLLAAESPAIWCCLDPFCVDMPKILDFGHSQNPHNEDIEERLLGNCILSGWAIVSLRRVAYLRDFFAVDAAGTVYLVNPPWRYGWMIDYFGTDPFEIRSRIERTNVYGIAASVANSAHTLDGGIKAPEPSITFSGHVHGHWLFEHLLPLGLWSLFDFYPNLYTMYLKSYQSDLLNLSGYKGQIREATSPIMYFDHLLLPVPWTRPTSAHVTNRELEAPENKKRSFNLNNMWWRGSNPRLLMSVRNLAARAKRHNSQNNRIYVRRDKNALHAVCLNEDDVCALALKYGFIVVDPATLDGEEEAAVFFSASLIMGTTGGGMENIIFSRPGSTIILLGAEDSVRPSISCVAASANMKLIRVRCPQFTSLDSVYLGSSSSYVVDLSLLESLIKTLI